MQDLPHDPVEYLNRIGREAAGEGGVGTDKTAESWEENGPPVREEEGAGSVAASRYGRRRCMLSFHGRDLKWAKADVDRGVPTFRRIPVFFSLIFAIFVKLVPQTASIRNDAMLSSCL